LAKSGREKIRGAQNYQQEIEQREGATSKQDRTAQENEYQHETVDEEKPEDGGRATKPSAREPRT